MRLVRSLLVCASLFATAFGCAANDDEPNAAHAGLTGVGGGSAEGAVLCGGTLCQPLTGPGIMTPVQVCCMDHFAHTCGVLFGRACRKVPPPHPTCASLDFGDFVLFGCCVENKCGLADEPEHMCRDLDSVRAEIEAEGGDASELPPSMPCE